MEFGRSSRSLAFFMIELAKLILGKETQPRHLQVFQFKQRRL